MIMSKLFFGLLLLPPIEIFLWILAAHFVSGWWIFWWTIIAVFMGTSLIRSGLSVLPKLQGVQGIQAFQLNSGTPEVGRALTRTLAGLLLVIPGLLTDAFALILLLPPVRYGVQKWAMRFFAKRQEAMMAQMRQSGLQQMVLPQAVLRPMISQRMVLAVQPLRAKPESLNLSLRNR
jgi:UPF0716 protein FxsA